MAKFLGETNLVYLWNKIKNYVSNAIAGLSSVYQAKESGKGLSTNDYTTAEKNKLGGIAAGAEVNVQANWAESNSSSDAYIQNKPTIPSKVSDLTNDTGFITAEDVPEGAAASTITPKMDGTAAKGTDNGFARGDHVHPSDTTKQDVIDSTHKLSADLISDGTTNKVYTATEKTKLSNIASGAEVNVVKSVDTTAGTSGINLSLSNEGALDVTISSGSIASGNSNFVTGGTVYSTTSTLAPKASPALTGTPTAPTANAGTSTTQIATTEFVTNAVATASAGVAAFQGTVAAASTITGSAYKKGWYWVVTTAGTYVGQPCEVGDMIFAIKDKGSAYAASDFSVVQNNMDLQEMTTAEMDTATDNWA